MRRQYGAVAALIVATAISMLALAPTATAQEATLTGDLAADGVSLATWGGGSADDLVVAAEGKGCGLVSFWVNASGGGLVGFIPTNISIVNEPFLAEYPDGVVAAGTPVLVVCRTDEGGTTPPPPTSAELPATPITATISQTYQFDAAGGALAFDQGAFPLPAGSVTANWYQSGGVYVIGYDGVDLSDTPALCPGNSIQTATGFQFITNDPTDAAPGACGNATGLAAADAGVQACGDLLVYITAIPVATEGTLFGTIEVIALDGAIAGMTGTVTADAATTPEIDLQELCG